MQFLLKNIHNFTLNDKNVMTLDETDKKILNFILNDAKMPLHEIGKKIFVSAGTVHARIKKMEQAGIIIGAEAKVDYTKLGQDVVAFLGIYLDKSSLYEDVLSQLIEIQEITGAHYTTGAYSIFAKIGSV